MKVRAIPKEISWSSFNARVLQEAADPAVPLIERIKFLAIFSSNLDEFFRVRVATLKRLAKVGKEAKGLIGEDPRKILKRLLAIILDQQQQFEKIYSDLRRELEREKIFMVDEKGLTPQQAAFARDYFDRKVRPTLIPIMVDQLVEYPELTDGAIYLSVALRTKKGAKKVKYALIEVPTDVLPRFLKLPSPTGEHHIMLLDDVIRLGLTSIFSILDFGHAEAYTIKVTRDAELDIDDGFSDSFIKKMSKGLEKRKAGAPVRFVYDSEMPEPMLDFLREHAGFDAGSDLIPGGRYHNFKDFMSLGGLVGKEELHFDSLPPLPHPAFESGRSIFKVVDKRDVLLALPYQSFDYVIDMLREASIDPKVTSVKMTLYRVAKNSNVINALINAARNGKTVVVVMELQARFDEEANIYWSNRLQAEGVKVIHGIKGLKIHSKLLLITRESKSRTTLYANVGTGNFNESTARLYTDHGLFTADKRITREVEKVFTFLDKTFKQDSFRHLLVSPYNARPRFTQAINREIRNAKKGQPSYIIVKLNNLTDTKIVRKLYEASAAGVEVRLMVRGMCSVVPGVEGMSENVQVRAVIDRFLEHTRLVAFCNNGDPQYFLTSSDWMPRNLDRRVEVSCPLYDPEIKAEIREYLELCWADNVKARIHTGDLDNQLFVDGRDPVRSQYAIYQSMQNRVFPGSHQTLRLAEPPPPDEEDLRASMSG